MSSWAVSGFMQIRTPMSRRRAMNPSFEARTVNQVGSPWMLEGKRFLPETGIPIWKIARIRMLLDDMLPEPLAVATWIEKSLTTLERLACSRAFSSRTVLTGSLLTVCSKPPAGTADHTKRGRKTRVQDRAGAPNRIQPEVPRMHFQRLVAAVALLAAGAGSAGAAPAGRPFRVDELASVKRVGGFAVSPGGQWGADSGGIADVEQKRGRSGLWLQAVSGGEPRKLTPGDKRDSDPKFSPDGKKPAFLSNRGGTSQIYVMDLSGGEPVKATAFPADIGGFRWWPDGGGFVFTAD